MKNALTTTSKNALAKTTTNKKTTVKTVENATKTNKLLTASQIRVLFIENNLIPQFSDNQCYVGVGVGGRNVFSVNTRPSKWSSYTIFCDDDRYNQIKSQSFENVTCTANCNNDKYRNNAIEVKNDNALKIVLKFIASQNKSFCLN